MQIDRQNISECWIFHRYIDKPKAQYEQSESQTKGLVNIYEFTICLRTGHCTNVIASGLTMMVDVKIYGRNSSILAKTGVKLFRGTAKFNGFPDFWIILEISVNLQRKKKLWGGGGTGMKYTVVKIST